MDGCRWVLKPVAWRSATGAIKRVVLAYDLESPTFAPKTETLVPTLVIRGGLDVGICWARENGFVYRVDTERIVSPAEGDRLEAMAER